MIELHWKDGGLLITGLPDKYRYFVAKRHQPGADTKGKYPVPPFLPGDILANDLVTVPDVHLPLPEGDFLFRARAQCGPNYEVELTTRDLPIRFRRRGYGRRR